MATKKRKAPAAVNAQEAVERLDSYAEVFLNIGTGGDPFNYGGLGRPRIASRVELERIYMSDGIGRRIIDIIPEEVFGSGFTIQGVDNMDEIRSQWDAIDATNKLIDAYAWARLFGGSLVIMGIDDGQPLEDSAGDGEITFLRVYDRYSVMPDTVEENPLLPNFGKPLTWKINPGNGMQEYIVHDSRCIIFDGERIPDRQRQRNNGWGGSVLQTLMGALKDLGVAHQMATSLLCRKQQGVWKIKGLAEMIRDKIGKAAIKERLNQVDMTRGNNNSIGLDAESEEYELLQGDLSGVPEIIKTKITLLTMLSGLHESILTGENVGGNNRSENTALASFHKLINRGQVDVGRPAIERIISRMNISVPEWKIVFDPLSEETDAERADRLQKEATADATYETAQILDSDEIRDTLRKRGDYVMKENNPEIVKPESTNQSDEELLNK